MALAHSDFWSQQMVEVVMKCSKSGTAKRLWIYVLHVGNDVLWTPSTFALRIQTNGSSSTEFDILARQLRHEIRAS